MNVGDMVIRKVCKRGEGRRAHDLQLRRKYGHGIVVSKQMAGTPAHPCITVWYPRVNKRYDIAESLMEVIGEVA